jgi:preprotein translocase subunit SecG
MSGRGQANFMTRMTAYLAGAFFVTSIGLSLLANTNFRSRSLFDTPAATQPADPKADAPATPTPAAPPAPPRGGILDKLQTPGGAQAPLPKQ